MLEIISFNNCECLIKNSQIRVSSERGIGDFIFKSSVAQTVEIIFSLKGLEGYYVNDMEICDKTSDDDVVSLTKTVKAEADTEIKIRFIDFYK
ncbi:hypothetical protein SS50377_27357 [Spironucleus salmonicida]|uniref:Uncharacterized protein n=1 Tax=Spironucleus salmonicida TaxID=348837 RepID=V6LI04_9EUKA|nr:hypothetical protein SS50377_27357 [Spironucleus salmonicida]|eukprot:EST43341.1 Hypothetical protein SS50377_17019 [Spironucleus salmonicida]